MLSDGVETVFVSFDTIRELDFIDIYEKDMTGMVKNDRRVAELIQAACKEVGYEKYTMVSRAHDESHAGYGSEARPLRRRNLRVGCARADCYGE